jgi:integrase/recombinase XerD
MLKLYRRHVKSCRYWNGKSSNGNRQNNNCRCPIWVDGYLGSERKNHSLKMRDWRRSSEIIRDWEIAGTVEPEVRSGTSVREACDAFLADAEAQRLSDASLKKYRVLLITPRKPENREKHSPSLSQFCAEAGLQFTTQISLPELSRFREQWKDGAISSVKKLERLRSFGRFLVDRGWWPENFATKLKRPKTTEQPTMPYTREEVAALLAACAQYTDWHGQTDRENARRLRAFLLLLRYAGLRVGDAASCSTERLCGNKLFLYTQKTKVPVNIPLPDFVVSALNACPRKSEQYWFWTGVGSKDTLAGNWRRTFRRLCRIAGVKGGHPHRFRDTLAVELLLDGMPIEQVSILLGHASVKITERHYAPWVPARQAQLESGLVRAWRNDPIAQMEILRGNGAPQKDTSQRMAATYPRHEKNHAPN